MRNRFITSLFLSLMLASFGCTSFQPKETTPIGLTYHDNKTSGDTSWPADELKKEFERYWSSRFSGLWEATWLMEAPYFQEISDKKKYEDFIKAHLNSRLLGIEIWSVEQESENLVAVRCEIAFEKNAESKKFFTKDKWVKVRSMWYHIIQDPILFPSSL